MNLFAHLHLSESLSDEETVGNVLGDFLPRLETLRPEMQRGVWRHRKIDAFTDSDALVAEARNLFGPKRRRLAGILVDIAFDYLLIEQWEKYSCVPFLEYVDAGYERLSRGVAEAPKPIPALVEQMRGDQWLECYGSEQGIALTLMRVSRRSRAASGLIGGEVEIMSLLPEIRTRFEVFYSRLQSHMKADGLSE